jgi:DNA-binding GntR family transcriptional regulator
MVIEELVVRRAATRGPGADDEGLARLVAEWRQVSERWPALRDDFEWPDFVYADERFHEQLARLSGNRAAVRHLREINERIRVVRIHDFTTPERIDTTIAEHLEIAAVVVAGDADHACRLMDAHVEHSAQVVERRIGELLTQMFDAGEEPA